MNERDAEQIWSEYYNEIKNRRLAEAELLWSEMVSKGVNSETVLAIDFRIFCTEEVRARNIEQQLLESYATNLNFSAEHNVWFISGTTRPAGVTLDDKTHFEWVNYMADLSAQNGCVFSNWTLEAPSLELTFSTKDIETN